MRFLKRILFLFAFTMVFYSNCSPPGFKAKDDTNLVTTAPGPSSNSVNNANNLALHRMPVTVGCGYVNQPCVSVTICQPGTSICQTINNLLLDTGSYGLRIFSSAINVSLPNAMLSGKSLAECMSYGDGSSQWGPIKNADLQIDGQTLSQVPIHVIDGQFASVPSDCTSLDEASSGYNGIFGVGFFKEDCGPGCASISNNRIYFSCQGTTCTSTAVPTSQQVINPLFNLSGRNNGILLDMPAISSSGAFSPTGYMYFGIDSNNYTTNSMLKVLQADSNGNITATYKGTDYDAFLDSGSNGLFFPDSTITACSANIANGFYCPSATISVTATLKSSVNTVQATASFSVVNAGTLLNTSNNTFNNLGGKLNSSFDLGLPFFLGRKIYIGYENMTTPMGSDTFWAY